MAIPPTPLVVRDVSTAESVASLVGFVAATGVFIGTVLYGLKRGHPWIGLLCAFGTSGVVSAVFMVGIEGAFPVQGGQIAVTPRGTQTV